MSDLSFNGKRTKLNFSEHFNSLDVDHGWLQHHKTKHLWGVDAFGPNDSGLSPAPVHESSHGTRGLEDIAPPWEHVRSQMDTGKW